MLRVSTSEKRGLAFRTVSRVPGAATGSGQPESKHRDVQLNTPFKDGPAQSVPLAGNTVTAMLALAKNQSKRLPLHAKGYDSPGKVSMFMKFTIFWGIFGDSGSGRFVNMNIIKSLRLALALQ